MLPLDKTRLIFVILVVVSIKLYIDHRHVNYKGEYDPNSNYNNITPLKHDVFEVLTVLFSLFAVYGASLGLGYPVLFFNSNNVLESWIGRAFVLVGSLLIFYEILQPYVLNKLKVF